ncbi:MAG: hypothetical protein K5751_09055 [Treponemataceae bacterium]|nr:hypothetical protein [Treponemataceae bacterium]
MNTQSDSGLLQSRELLKKGDALSAKQKLEEALSCDLENKDIIYTLRCANYWAERLANIVSLTTPFERGEALVEQWKHFSNFIGTGCEQSLYAVKCGIFNLALENYSVLLNDSSSVQYAEILRKTGLCHKKLGDYDTALKFLNDANTRVPQSASIIAEMADCYALCGEEKIAKLLFREAFFIDAQKVDISFLESELVTQLINQVEAAGYSGNVLKEWIPVYGVLYGVFNIKRELRVLEACKLKQNVFALENELKEAGCEPSLLVPRLINHYFWLVDYYVNTNDDRMRINEILLKIKLLDSSVHKKYIV